jgi:hypothetical protein
MWSDKHDTSCAPDFVDAAANQNGAVTAVLDPILYPG